MIASKTVNEENIIKYFSKLTMKCQWSISLETNHNKTVKKLKITKQTIVWLTELTVGPELQLEELDMCYDVKDSLKN
jgi:hypothetical protein